MRTSTGRLRDFVEQGLAENGKPKLDKIIATNRPSTGWHALAVRVSIDSGVMVSGEWLRRHFSQLETAGGAA